MSSFGLQDMLNFIWAVILLVLSYVEAMFRYFFPISKKDLTGKIVLITGGGGGLGKHLAISFAKCGATIVLWDIEKESNDRNRNLVKAMKFNAFSYQCDCSDQESVAKMAEKVEAEIGPIDILVNNAGVLNGNSITVLSEKQIRSTFDVNVLAQFWTIKAFLPGMMQRSEGHIVTVSSSAGLNGTSYLTDYSASKFALVGIHESLALELREQGFHNIQMTCVCPNFINTGMTWYPKTNVPWLIPILQVEDAAQDIVDAVREDRNVVVLPKVLGKVLSLKRLIPLRGQLAIYDYLGIGIEPHLSHRKSSSSLSRKRSPKMKSFTAT